MSSVVRTERTLDKDGLVVPPPGWELTRKYAADWDVDLSDPITDFDVYNQSVDDVRDLAWLIRGIPSIKVAVLGSTVVELLQLNWLPCWVPLGMVNLNTAALVAQVEVARKSYASLGPRAKTNMRKDIPAHVRRVLARVKLTAETTFMIRHVSKFAVVSVPGYGKGKDVEVLKADFMETYEHSSMLFQNKDLWRELCGRRVEAGKSHILKSGECAVMRDFVRKGEEALAAPP